MKSIARLVSAFSALADSVLVLSAVIDAKAASHNTSWTAKARTRSRPRASA
jgi:hypothetical protein